ncbi:MAG: hypothetical protein KAR39_10125 [Thermoplasmata archaeon]|nr:hypothetical protein [Thermoplasmata archaeon]
MDRLYPPDRALLSPGDQWIELNFTEAMNRTSVENSIVITPYVDYHPRNTFWTVDNTTFFFVIFVPTDGTYHFTLQDTAKDINETRIDSSFSWSYIFKGEAITAGGEEFHFPWWVGVLPATSPIVLIFVVWFLYEWNKKRKLTPEQREKLRNLQPTKLDTLDKTVLILFAIVLVAAGLFFAFGWTDLIIVVGILGPIVGLLAMFAFAIGASSVSSSRKFVEMTDSEFTEAQMKTYTWEERVKSIKQIVIGMLILFAILSMVSVLTAYLLFGGDAFSMLSGFLYFVPIFVVLIIFYYYFSRRRDSGSQ